MSRRGRRPAHEAQQKAAPPPSGPAPGDRSQIDLPAERQLWGQPYTRWDPTTLLTAKTAADEGSLELVADLVESLMADDRVSAALEQRVQGLEGLPLTFQGADARVVEALQMDFWEMATPGTRSAIRRWGAMVGICPVYVRAWVEGTSGRLIPLLEQWHPRWLRWHHAEEAWYIRTQEKHLRISDQPGRWFLYCPFGDPQNRPWVSGIWYSTATWFLAKSFAIADMGNFSQAHATPKYFLSVRSEAGGSPSVSKDDKMEAIRWLSKVPTRAGIYVPWPFEIRQEEAGSQAWQVYKEIVQLANRGLAARILGQTLTTDEAGGAGAIMDDKLRQDAIEADADADSAWWHDGPVTWWYRLNICASSSGPIVRMRRGANGAPRVVTLDGTIPWPVWDTTPPEDLRRLSETQEAVSRTLVNLASAGEKSATVSAAVGQVNFTEYLGRYFPMRGREDTTGRALSEHAVGASEPARGPVLLLDSGPRDLRQPLHDALSFVDAAVDELSKRSPRVMEDIATHVLKILADARDYEDARRRLLEAFPELAADRLRLRDVLTGGMLLAQAAGHYSVGRER